MKFLASLIRSNGIFRVTASEDDSSHLRHPPVRNHGTVIAIRNHAEGQMMKRFFGLLIAAAILATVASPAFAQNCRRRTYYEPARTSRVYDNSSIYYGDPNAYYDYRYRRNFWDRHRDKLTLAIGTGAGAAVGGLIGGRRGAVIGAASGLGGSALYTYRLRNRRYRY